jgi:6-phosphogluconolactonase (cycloisomerase 2 family)
MNWIVPRQMSLPLLRLLVLTACVSGTLAACNGALDSAGETINGGSTGSGTIGGSTTSSSSGGSQGSYTIGGNVTGVSGTGLVLANNMGDNLTIIGNGSFTFSNSAAVGAGYNVTIVSQPLDDSQTCVVSDGLGTVGTANVTSIVVTCTTALYTVGGSVTGLVGSGLVLQTNGGDNFSVPASGSYTFSTLPSGSDYAITVLTQPSNPSQTCSIANDTGTVGSTNVTNVAVTCTTNSFAVSATVTGLTGAGLVVQTNGANAVPVAGNGSYTLANLPSGSTYTVTVQTQPLNPSQTCTVGNATGTLVSADVTNVTIHCATSSYTIGGTVTGLLGSALTLQDNGGDNQTVAANGTFTFATRIASNGTYSVTVATQPTEPAQLCRVTEGTGTVTTANITTVAINCTSTGRYLFAANPFDANGSVAAFTIDPVTGALTAAANSPYATAEVNPYFVAVDPSGQYLYVANNGSALVSTDLINAGATLTQDVSTASTGTQNNRPFTLVVDPVGPYVYVGGDDNANGTVEAYTANAGVLTPVTGALNTSTYLAGNDPYYLAVDPVYPLLWAPIAYDSVIRGYGIGGGGALAAVAGSPFAFGTVGTNQPWGVAITPTGGKMYVTDDLQEFGDLGTVTAYSYGANGTLVKGNSYGVGLYPQGVTIDPTGRFLYVTNSGDGTVSAFTIAADGTLTTITGPFVSTTGNNVPSQYTPTAIQVDPSGQFLYVANGDDGTITGFRINQSTGALTQVTKVGTVINYGGPSSIAIE